MTHHEYFLLPVWNQPLLQSTFIGGNIFRSYSSPPPHPSSCSFLKGREWGMGKEGQTGGRRRKRSKKWLTGLVIACHLGALFIGRWNLFAQSCCFYGPLWLCLCLLCGISCPSAPHASLFLVACVLTMWQAACLGQGKSRLLEAGASYFSVPLAARYRGRC